MGQMFWHIYSVGKNLTQEEEAEHIINRLKKSDADREAEIIALLNSSIQNIIDAIVSGQDEKILQGLNESIEKLNIWCQKNNAESFRVLEKKDLE